MLLKKSLLSLGLIATAALAKAQTSPCLSVPIAMEQRIQEATRVVYGTETDRFCTWDDEQKSLVTLHAIDVVYTWKGDIVRRVWVLTEGGQLGSLGRSVSGAAQIQAGQSGAWMLKPVTHRTFAQSRIADVYQLATGPQGLVWEENQAIADCWGSIARDWDDFQNQFTAAWAHYTIAMNPEIETDLQVKGRALASISSTSPNPIMGGVQTLTIEGSGFGSSQGNSYVSFTRDGSNYYDANTAKGFVYKSWSDSKIEVEMPESFSGKVRVYVNGVYGESASNLSVKANVGMATVNPREYFHLWNLNEKGGHTWYIRKDLYNNSEARACIEGVFQEFRCKTGVNYTLTRTPTWVKSDLGDGVNALMFDSVGYELPMGVVAYYEQLWYSCILGGRTFYYAVGQELRISTRFDYYYGKGSIPQGKNAKLSYVLFHELGHSIQLGHVNEDGESMHPVVQALPADNWNQRDTLTTFDVLAGRYLVQESQQFDFRGCGVNPMSVISNCADVYGENVASETPSQHLGLRVVPNPAVGPSILYFEGVQGAVSISILNAQGQTVAEAQVNDTHWDLPTLSAGTYFIAVQSEQGLGFVRCVVP